MEVTQSPCMFGGFATENGHMDRDEQLIDLAGYIGIV